MHVVGLAAIAGAPVFEIAVPSEVFGIARPEIAEPWYQLRVCGPQIGEVGLAGGFAITATHDYQGLETADTVIVPACANVHADQSPALLTAVRVAHARGARIASICSGAFVLAAAGLLDGLGATTHWLHAEELQRRFPSVTVDAQVLYRQEGRVFTSAGTGAALDLCLELVRQDRGSGVANRLARRMVIAPHRPGGQAQFLETPIPPLDEHFSDLLEWARSHLDRPLTLAALAATASSSERTLARRFHDALGTSPIRWLTEQRVRRAQELLELSDQPVERISELVGFARSSSLRTHFTRIVGVSPAAYRRTFQDRAGNIRPRPTVVGTS